MNARLARICVVVPALFSGIVPPAVDAEDPRVVVLLTGSDDFVADLKYLCVDLAGERTDWENNVFPNVDIFLIGVEPTHPIRRDLLIGGQRGLREQFMAPIVNLNNFINANLIPIGINVAQDPLDRNLYQLRGAFNGWMRIKAGYAIFALDLDDVPLEMPSPRDSHDELRQLGHDFTVRLDNRQTTPEQRMAAFAAYRDNALARIQRRPEETHEAFALHRRNNEQALETIEQLFVESSQITCSATVDSRRNIGKGSFELIPLPDTRLAETIQRQAQQPSRFAGLVSPDEAVVSARINCTLGPMTQRHAVQFCRLMQAPWNQRIDRADGLTDIRKSARKDIAGIVLDILVSSLERGRCDGMIEVRAHPGGNHSGLAAISVKNGERATRILELLPASDSRFRSQLNIDRTGDIAIHKLTIMEGSLQALQDFFGPSGELYVGAGPDSIWISMGEDAYAALKAGIEAATASRESRPDSTVAALDLELLPVLKVLNQLRTDGDFDVISTLQSWGMIEPDWPAENREPADEPADDAATMLRDYEWRDVVIDGLDADADRLHLDLRRVEDRLEGNGTIEVGILKAIGELIADFAKENLS